MPGTAVVVQVENGAFADVDEKADVFAAPVGPMLATLDIEAKKGYVL